MGRPWWLRQLSPALVRLKTAADKATSIHGGQLADILLSPCGDLPLRGPSWSHAARDWEVG